MAGRPAPSKNGDTNKLLAEDRPAHDWYRFVLSFPPHLIREYLSRFGVTSQQLVLDPFCGTGTTLVECKKMGIRSVGVEANPLAHFASRVKLDWSVSPGALTECAQRIARQTSKELQKKGIVDEELPLLRQNGRMRNGTSLESLPREAEALLLSNSISPLPLHKSLCLLRNIRKQAPDDLASHLLLAAVKVVVFQASNLHFGPEVGVRAPKKDAPVIGPWLSAVHDMGHHLADLSQQHHICAKVYCGDARQVQQVFPERFVDCVITSPPYPNEKDYTRTTRLESVLLGLVEDRLGLRRLKRQLLRSNTRGVYKNDDDDRCVQGHAEIERIASAIEARRIKLGKTSGFERMYSRVTRLYFGGMKKHLSDLRAVLGKGAKLAYVVGDQASYLRVMIRTGELLADIAQSLGYRVLAIDLFRTRLSTATRMQLREEVVVLEWPG